MPLLFALTMFVSATLLFLVQPMIGKMVLPLLGGTPAVWNTCMVFYQALLLAGYYYAHKSTSTYATAKQTKLHAIVMLAALGAMMVAAIMTADNSPIPIVKSLSPQGTDYPFFGVIVLLLVAIGLPFFVVSTSAPLLQKWFAETGHPSAKDPYFLYAASNFGSLLALVAYPAIVEPNLRLIHQAWVWAVGYAILVGLVAACARVVSRAPAPVAPPPVPRKGKTAYVPPPPAPEVEPTTLRKLRWLGLAFVPSSLMLGLTTFVSTDMASIPLLWIIPLSLYLITFIIVFSKVPPAVHLSFTLVMPVMVLLIVFLMTSHVKASFGMQVLLHMITFFVVTMVCHGELAHDRPSPKYLTNFYLIMSIGGMLGGLFNALAAPIVFTFTSEYPITLVAACFLLPTMFDARGRRETNGTHILDVLCPLAVFFIASNLQTNATDLGSYFYDNGKYILTAGTLFALPAGLAVALLEKDIRSRIVLGILLGGGLLLFGLTAAFDGTIGNVASSIGGTPSEGNKGYTAARMAVRLVPVALLVSAFVWYWKKYGRPETRNQQIGIGMGCLLVCFAVMLGLADTVTDDFVAVMAQNAHIAYETVKQILIFGMPAMICYFFVERPLRFGAAVAALWLATFWTEYRADAQKYGEPRPLYDRSFFGRLKIEKSRQWDPIARAAEGQDLALLPQEVFDRTLYKARDGKAFGGERNAIDVTEFWTVPADGRESRPAYRVVRYRMPESDQEYSRAFISREYVQLIHGTTVHGLQETHRLERDVATALLPALSTNWVGEAAIEAQYRRDVHNAAQYPGRNPLTYYHRTGPVGSMFDAWWERRKGDRDANTAVGCIGMGTASLTAYGKPKQKMTIFEIDTHVRRLVEPPDYFNYVDLAKKQGVDLDFVMGDARISLERDNRKFGFLLIDAFSSDAIPAHLLTKQAVQLYFDRLEDDGLLAVHISNRYLDLEPVVERIARELGLEARVMHGSSFRSERDLLSEEGRYAATWIAIARNKKALGAIAEDTDRWLTEENQSQSNRWIPLTKDDSVGLWTDDYSPIIPILKGEWKFWKSSGE